MATPFYLIKICNMTDEELSIEIDDGQKTEIMKFHPRFLAQEIGKLLDHEKAKSKKHMIDTIKHGHIYKYNPPNPEKIDEELDFYFDAMGYGFYLTDEETLRIYGPEADEFHEDALNEILPTLRERAIKYIEEHKDLIQPEWTDYFQMDPKTGKYKKDDKERYDKDTTEWAKRVYADFKKKNKDSILYIFEVDDDSFLTSYFQYNFDWEKKVPCLKIYNH